MQVVMEPAAGCGAVSLVLLAPCIMHVSAFSRGLHYMAVGLQAVKGPDRCSIGSAVAVMSVW